MAAKGIDLKGFSDGKLAKLSEQFEKEQRRRRIAALVAEGCGCDRYTCPRCHQLYDVLHYDPKTEEV
jgi:hypothetical protein